MRILLTLPHYFATGDSETATHGSLRQSPDRRLRALLSCLQAVLSTFGRPQCLIDIERRTTVPANHAWHTQVDLVVCTTGDCHLLTKLPSWCGGFRQVSTHAEPKLLGYECHAVLRDQLKQNYDFYGYLEDDLLLRDSLFFHKLRWFQQQFGSETLLLPNRYEVGGSSFIRKAYVDGPIRPQVTDAFQNVHEHPILEGELFGETIRFERVSNPHSGSFFLTGEQLRTWSGKPYFLDRSRAFIGPLESAATLGVMRTFRIYKPSPTHAAFLEIEHFGQAFVQLIKPQTENSRLDNS